MPKDVPFSWKSCGPSNQAVDIRSLTISPSPLSFPGDLTFGFDIMFHETISSDRKVSVSTLYRPLLISASCALTFFCVCVYA